MSISALLISMVAFLFVVYLVKVNPCFVSSLTLVCQNDVNWDIYWQSWGGWRQAGAAAGIPSHALATRSSSIVYIVSRGNMRLTNIKFVYSFFNISDILHIYSPAWFEDMENNVYRSLSCLYLLMLQGAWEVLWNFSYHISLGEQSF